MLDQRVILITGAAGTIGRAIAKAARAAGATVLGADIRPEAGVDHEFDVTDEAAWARVCGLIERDHGRLDGLVNNAGVLHIGTIEETSPEDWRRVMSVNADGVFLGCRAAWPLLKASADASVVNISSIAGIVGGANMAAYNASKGAVRLLTKSLALHGARHDPPIRCNSVHPAFVEGAMAEQALRGARDPEKAREKMRASIPLGRFARPEEVAAAVVHLLSPASGFTTGSETILDGGLSA
jgi:NAD(P)-dependent dehydrogenase (short-subunit alcohol dehydrogenase family)